MLTFNFLSIIPSTANAVNLGTVREEKIILPVQKTTVAVITGTIPEQKVQQVHTDYQKRNFSFSGHGKATYYGAPLHGRRTASGEIFDMNGMTTAAISSYAFGTKLKVTNEANGKSVIVKVTDRGAFEGHGTTLDLSEGAFAQIGSLSQGVLWVKIEVLVN